MFKQLLVAAALALPVASFAVEGPANGGTATDQTVGKTNVNPTGNHTVKKATKAACEVKVKNQGLKDPAKAKAAIAACEKNG
jgi:hypothetical protein